ncbi:apoptosis-enhancing nuclease [Brienomyrus brachyistius]|uniref:apoptosis-enhancing nuclease n=1 Tax=Brienomyrus brachyistius TaxID=42636 RepID=UPI0020B18E44|nr:apoptosis-enhancing nuclease [Brienomyrus brachyistius]XP_048886627.1 apoptosis-enhancing nuclease [Brienomyrus brachyistius]
MPGLSCCEMALENVRSSHDPRPPGPIHLSLAASPRGAPECRRKKNPATNKWLRIQAKRAVLEKSGVLQKKKQAKDKPRDRGGLGSVALSPDPGIWGDFSFPPRTEVPSDILSVAGSPAWHLSGTSKAGTMSSVGERWETDSGVSSAASPPVSGRNSPCPCANPAKVVAIDCEMVGTGPGGRFSEVARCSTVNYHGEVLYDKYIQPLRPVVNYRTRWSGISQQHLVNAVPFDRAQREILQLLKGKVVVGHALHNDFRALGFVPPRHLIRDTSRSRELRRLCDFPLRGSVSLKNLAKTLLHRKIQTSRQGHCSVEDAIAAMDLYKLVETQWEQNVLDASPSLDTDSLSEAASTASHYMQDQYWPEEISNDCK